MITHKWKKHWLLDIFGSKMTNIQQINNSWMKLRLNKSTHQLNTNTFLWLPLIRFKYSAWSFFSYSYFSGTLWSFLLLQYFYGPEAAADVWYVTIKSFTWVHLDDSSQDEGWINLLLFLHLHICTFLHISGKSSPDGSRSSSDPWCSRSCFKPTNSTKTL